MKVEHINKVECPKCKGKQIQMTTTSEGTTITCLSCGHSELDTSFKSSGSGNIGTIQGNIGTITRIKSDPKDKVTIVQNF